MNLLHFPSFRRTHNASQLPAETGTTQTKTPKVTGIVQMRLANLSATSGPAIKSSTHLVSRQINVGPQVTLSQKSVWAKHPYVTATIAAAATAVIGLATYAGYRHFNPPVHAGVEGAADNIAIAIGEKFVLLSGISKIVATSVVALSGIAFIAGAIKVGRIAIPPVFVNLIIRPAVWTCKTAVPVTAKAAHTYVILPTYTHAMRPADKWIGTKAVAAYHQIFG